MPTHFQDGAVPVVRFDPLLEISPFTLFRRLKQSQDLLLADVRQEAGTRTLENAVDGSAADWTPPDDRPVVLFDDDGATAYAAVQRLQSEGFEQARALFGGLDLYEFSLDPEVVGQETFLAKR